MGYKILSKKKLQYRVNIKCRGHLPSKYKARIRKYRVYNWFLPVNLTLVNSVLKIKLYNLISNGNCNKLSLNRTMNS